jgi:hypothetical protein
MPELRFYPRSLPGGTEKNYDEPQSRLAGVPAEIRTHDFPNTSLSASTLNTNQFCQGVLGETLVVTQLVRTIHIFRGRERLLHLSGMRSWSPEPFRYGEPRRYRAVRLKNAAQVQALLRPACRDPF